MSEPIRVLALHAHPDDVEFQCAGTLVLLARGGLPRDDRHDDPGRLRQCRARCRGDRGDPPRGGAGVGRADRGGLSSASNSATWRSSTTTSRGGGSPRSCGGSRPDDHPDGPAGRLHRRSRDDQPAGPRRLLRGALPQLHDAAVGAGARRWRRSRTSTSSTRSRAATATAGRCPVDFHVDVSRVFATKRADARLSRQPAQLAAPPARDRRIPRDARRRWGASRGAEIGVAQAEAFRQYRGHPYPQDNLLLDCSSRTAGASRTIGRPRVRPARSTPVTSRRSSGVA